MTINILNWIRIIAMILDLIAGGMEKTDAVKRASRIHKVSEKSIWKHGGF